MASKLREYQGDGIVVMWDAKRCIHAKECVKGLPAVFDENKRPWIQPADASPIELADVIVRCPSGALHFAQSNSGPVESPPESNIVVPVVDGPVYVHGDLKISTSDGETLRETRVALCWCVASENKPYCDNSHLKIQFQAPDRITYPENESTDVETGGALEVLTFRRFDGREVSLVEFPLAQGLRTGETVRAEEIVLQAPDGQSVTTLINATPIFSEEGEVESVVVTMQDMTPMEELERLRAEFLGMVSHELRTPLAAVKGSVDTLLESASDLDPAEMMQFFRIIRDQSENMRYLISDLLDVARIETGTLPVSLEPVEAGVLVDEARSRFQSGGGRSNLVIDLPPDLPRVMADRRRIVQALGNLLSNAAHHSNELSPIRVAAVRDGVHVAFSVADDGVGVPGERLPHLFRKFSQLDGEERGREIAGSGLGLAICKGIVEAHGGRIRAESDGPGLGSRFTFTVPAVEETVTLRPPPSRRRRTKTRERPRVLCVDDDPQTLRYVRDALTKAGYTPVVTGDPEEVSRPPLGPMDRRQRDLTASKSSRVKNPFIYRGAHG